MPHHFYLGDWMIIISLSLKFVGPIWRIPPIQSYLLGGGQIRGKIARGLGVPTFVRTPKKCDDLENSRRGSIPFLLHIPVWFQTRCVDKKKNVFCSDLHPLATAIFFSGCKRRYNGITNTGHSEILYFQGIIKIFISQFQFCRSRWHVFLVHLLLALLVIFPRLCLSLKQLKSGFQFLLTWLQS